MNCSFSSLNLCASNDFIHKMTVERMRAYRGLLLRFGKSPLARFKYLARGLMSGSDVPFKGRTKNICHWCKRPVKSRKGSMGYWHPLCVRAQFACRGLTHLVDRQPVIPKGTCATCGKDHYLFDTGPHGKGIVKIHQLEIDHIVALGIAARRGDRRGVLRAYTLDNLQWLCPPCHKRKTASDRKIMANLDKGLPEDHVPEPKVLKPKTTWLDKVPEGQELLFP